MRRWWDMALEELIARATLFIVQHGAWAGPVVGLLAFAESLAFIGLLVPATTLIITVGGLIGVGTVDPLPVILCATLGAVLGDWISYAIGRRIGPSIYRRWPLNRNRQAVARTRLFFRRYGFVAVFLGRFLGPIRAIIPLVAGVMEMGQRRFQLANILSAVLWIPTMLAPGWLAARSIGTVDHVTGWHLLGAGLAVAGLTLGASMVGAKILKGGARRRGRRLTEQQSL